MDLGVLTGGWLRLGVLFWVGVWVGRWIGVVVAGCGGIEEPFDSPGIGALVGAT